ncbi:MAG: hypothetical protein AVDCRST_MAG68-5135 [uncultured Gemmatimonadetes bacterium]|uniref:HNH nuclease domain-containing protein n=1 Tax=uncultured Gemmatimonadota bacterium TaxID=203437 RepID=A0A6J4MUW7_9BACT|nr:MAG: hypothetical protein AVDCRST_MAG68-5135 [uncultured Gemmatimonadota bacterium]
MAVSKRLRHEVMRRDNHTCKYCGATAPDVKLTIDHVTPVTLGGSDDPTNLVTACADCNAGKSATPPDAALVADVDRKAVEWSRAMQLAVEQRAAELATERASTEPFDHAWSCWTVAGEPVPRDANWRGSIQRFLAAGLTDEFFAAGIENTMGQTRIPASDKWRYFCGICWREVDTLQAMARQIATESAPGPAANDWDDVFEKLDPTAPFEVQPNGTEMAAENKYSVGAHPLFPAIEMCERYMQRLLEALGASRYVVDEAGHVLWDTMEVGYRAFMADEVDWAGSADERVTKAIDQAMAGFILRIKLAQPTWEPSNGS